MKVPINWLKDYVDVPSNIHELGEKLTMVGHMLDKIEKGKEETILDLELRGNRADCYSIIGIAREVSAIYKRPLLLPKIYEKKLKKVENLKEIKLNIKSELVKRVVMVAIKNVKIGPSPDFMRKRLMQYGIPPINNIVDATNYVMVETGEPMHAFDLELLRKEIEIRLARPRETLITFEGTKINLTKDDLIFANDKSPLSVAGAIGGKNYSIQPSTKSILLEAACYDRANIRRTARRHNIMTEAGLRHEKELDPNLVSFAMLRFLELIKENNWGTFEHEIYDYYPEPRKEITLSLNFENLEKIGGLKIDQKIAKKIIKSLYFTIKKENPNQITVSVPTFRTDIVEEADLIEEVLRIYGYEKIPAQTLSLEIPKDITLPQITQEQKIKESLIQIGFDETITSSFVYDKDKNNNLSIDNDTILKPVCVSNPPSPDFQIMRMSLLPNLLECAKKVGDERGEEARFFEAGKIYFRKKKEYFERRKLGMIFWKKDKPSFIEFKGYIETLFLIFGINHYVFNEASDSIFPSSSFSVSFKNKTIAVGGQIKENAYFVEIDLDLILGKEEINKVSLWPKFPPIIEDLSFIVSPKTLAGEMIDQIKIISKLIVLVELIDSYQITRTFRITYQCSGKTLTDKTVKKIRKTIIEKIEKRFHANLKA